MGCAASSGLGYTDAVQTSDSSRASPLRSGSFRRGRASSSEFTPHRAGPVGPALEVSSEMCLAASPPVGDTHFVSETRCARLQSGPSWHADGSSKVGALRRTPAGETYSAGDKPDAAAAARVETNRRQAVAKRKHHAVARKSACYCSGYAEQSSDDWFGTCREIRFELRVGQMLIDRGRDGGLVYSPGQAVMVPHGPPPPEEERRWPHLLPLGAMEVSRQGDDRFDFKVRPPNPTPCVLVALPHLSNLLSTLTLSYISPPLARSLLARELARTC